jgi:hypothetical protein
MVDARGRVAKADRKPGHRVLSATTRPQPVAHPRGGRRRRHGYPGRSRSGQVADKTGTARKPDNERGGYRPGAYVVSYIGYAPASRPAGSRSAQRTRGRSASPESATPPEPGKPADGDDDGPPATVIPFAIFDADAEAERW